MIDMDKMKDIISSSKNGYFSEPREDLYIEYKTSSFKLPKNVWETFSSFANTDGGIIVLGIKEDKKNDKYEITGVDVPNDIKRDLFNGNHNSSIISVPVIKDDDVIIYEVKGKTVIQIRVREASHSNKPVYINGHKDNCFIRTDDGDRKADDNEYKALMIGNQDNIDSELLNNYDLEDLNLNDVSDYKKLMSKNTDNEDILNQDDFEFLKDVGVFRRDRSNDKKEYKLTTGGLLFFGKYNSINQRFPNFQLDYFHYPDLGTSDWDDRISSGDMNFPSLNIFSFYNMVLPKLISGVSDRFHQNSNFNRGSYYSDLTRAVKEALVNVLMHSYYDGEYPIKVVDRKVYFEFSNPGSMRVSLDSFFRGAITLGRNTIISNLFRKVGISEKAGSGGPRILKSALNNHLHFPDLEKKFDYTSIRIWKIDRLTSLKMNDNNDIGENEEKILKIALDRTIFKMKDVFGDSDDQIKTYYQANKSMNKLISNDIIEPVGKSSARKYKIKLNDSQNMIENIRIIKQIEDSFMGFTRK